jgi:hypothetical protein
VKGLLTADHHELGVMYMRELLYFILVMMALYSASATAQENVSADGQVRETEAGVIQAWDAMKSEWVSAEAFWRHYADRRGGLTWGSRTEYPPYSKVKEFDTMIINVPRGPCLMEFFHTRWRRANNVQRWSEKFDEYGGCPYVFD